MTEIIIASLLFIVFLLLIRINFFLSVVVALFLSTLIHKELFSIYIWDLMLIRVAMLAYVVSYFFDFIKFNKFSLKFLKYLNDPFIFLILMFVVSKFLSLPYSLNFQSSFFLAVFYLAISLFVLTLYVKLDFNQVLKLIKSYIGIALFLSLITFVQMYFYFNHSFLFGAILNIAGKNPIFPEFNLSFEYFTELLKLIVMTRVGSLFWDVNHFGGFLASLILPAGVFWVAAREKFEKNFFLAATLIMSLVLFLTNSRSAWLLFGVAVLVFLISFVSKKYGVKGIALFLSLILVVSVFLTFLYLDKDSLFRFKVRSYFHYRMDSFDSHFLLLNGTVQVFDKFPILGGGVGSFFEHFKSTPLADEFLRRDPAGLNVKVPAHTIWGEVLAETGVFGMFFFVLLVLFIIGNQLFSLIHSKKEDLLLNSAFFGTTVGWLVAGIFYSYNSEFFYLCLFLPLIYQMKRFNLNLNLVLGYFSKKSFYSLLLIFPIFCYVLFFNLGVNKLIPFDEAIYGSVAKNMFNSSDYLTLRWIGNNEWFEKPPLIFWLMSLSFNFFDISEFALRFPSALAGLVTLFVTYKLTKLLSSTRSGIFAVVALATNITFLYYSRMAMIDVLLTMFILLAVYFFIVAEKYSLKRYFVFSGISIGLAVMTKSVIGFFPIIFIGSYFLFEILKKKDFRTIVRYLTKFLYVIIPAFLVLLPWHITMIWMYGDKFLNPYLGYHVLSRFTTTIEEKGGPWDFYLTVIKISMRLYFVVLIPAVIYFIYKFYKEKFSSFFFLIASSSILTVLFFSLSSSKLMWYVIPAFPFLSVIVGVFLGEIISKLESYHKNNVTTFVLTYTLIFVSFFYLYMIRERVYTHDLTGREVEMILANNRRKPDSEDEILLVDVITFQLTHYYSDEKFESVLYSGLKEKLLENEKIKRPTVFITRESRFQDLSKNVTPNIEIIAKNKDYMLGKLIIEND